MLRYNLVNAGYDVSTAGDGSQALEKARSIKPDLLLLDIMLPVLDGLEVCRILRKETGIPIIMLTAKSEEIDRVVGLELGADDYITKPFSLRELMARIKAALRRSDMSRQETPAVHKAEHSLLRSGNLEINLSSHIATLGERELMLSHKEFELLSLLVKNRGMVFTREQLLQKVWGYDYAGNTRTVDVHIRWLRQKIELNPDKPVRLLTVRGTGYKFEG